MALCGLVGPAEEAEENGEDFRDSKADATLLGEGGEEVLRLEAGGLGDARRVKREHENKEGVVDTGLCVEGLEEALQEHKATILPEALGESCAREVVLSREDEECKADHLCAHPASQEQEDPRHVQQLQETLHKHLLTRDKHVKHGA